MKPQFTNFLIYLFFNSIKWGLWRISKCDTFSRPHSPGYAGCGLLSFQGLHKGCDALWIIYNREETKYSGTSWISSGSEVLFGFIFYFKMKMCMMNRAWSNSLWWEEEKIYLGTCWIQMFSHLCFSNILYVLLLGMLFIWKGINGFLLYNKRL